MSLGGKFLPSQNKVTKVGFILRVSDEVDLTCSEGWSLVRLWFLTGEEVTHLGGPPGLMPTLWCPAGGCLNVPEVGLIFTQKFSKGFGSLRSQSFIQRQ